MEKKRSREVEIDPPAGVCERLKKEAQRAHRSFADVANAAVKRGLKIFKKLAERERVERGPDRRKGQITYREYCALHGLTPDPEILKAPVWPIPRAHA